MNMRKLFIAVFILFPAFFLFAQVAVKEDASLIKTTQDSSEKDKLSPEKTAAASPKPSMLDKALLKKATPAVRSVAQQLESLLKPSDLQNKVVKRLSSKPYLKIIKGGSDKSTLIYRCRSVKGKSLINALESIISPLGTVEESPEQNLVIINDKSEKMEELKKAVLALDVSAPQILVEAKIVELLLGDGQERKISFDFNRHDSKQNKDSSAGVTTNSPGAPTNFNGGQFDWYPYIAGEVGDSVYKNFQTTVNWLMTANDAKILSAPNLIVSLGTTASIVTGQDIPIQTISVVSGSQTTATTFKRVGVVLNVTPKLINEQSVTIQVSPNVSNVQRYEQVTQGTGSYPVPVIAVRNISTELTLNDGQIIMLGGLYLNTEKQTQERTPILSDIPFIGELFTGKNQTKELTQLIFFLKINVLTPEEIATGVIYDPGKQAETLRKVGDLIKNSKQIFPERDETSVEKIKKEFIDDAVGTQALDKIISDDEKKSK